MQIDRSNISDESAAAADWETTSISSTTSSHPPSTSSDHSTDTTSPPIVSKDPPKAAQRPFHNVLDEYWIERAKFIKHLEKRAKKFNKRSKEDYDAARWGKPKPKKQPKPIPPPPVVAPVDTVAPPSESEASETNSPIDSSDSDEMFASTSYKGIARAATTAANVVPIIPARNFSASTVVTAPKKQAKAKKVRNPLLMTITEATRVLRAVEIDKSSSAYHLVLNLKSLTKGNQKINVRGRVVLPHDHRKSADVVLVFAEKGSLSARLAREAGVDYVGDQDLIQPLIDGEINPTKVLSTPGMLSVITPRLARFLGPKGMMPTTRRGGVGEEDELVKRIQEAKGALDWIADDRGQVKTSVGRLTFDFPQVEANVRAILDSIRAALTVNTNNTSDEHLVSRRKPAKSTTGIEKAYLSSSFGPPIEIKDL